MNQKAGSGSSLAGEKAARGYQQNRTTLASVRAFEVLVSLADHAAQAAHWQDSKALASAVVLVLQAAELTHQAAELVVGQADL